jgi:site-specific DNA-cytosine methylase
MSTKQSKTTTASKKAKEQAAAGKPAVDSAQGAATGSVSSQESKIDIDDVVKQLEQNYATMPKLDKLINNESQHSEVTRAIQTKLGAVSSRLSLGKNIIAKGLAEKLTPVERTKLRTMQTKYSSLLRKVNKSNRSISRELIDNAKAERQSIHLDDLRDKVKDRNYYNKYGGNIAPAFAKWIASPMTKELHQKLVQVKASRPANFAEVLTKVLSIENPVLYIKSTGDKKRKAGYFAEFRKALNRWQPRRAHIKSNKIY